MTITHDIFKQSPPNLVQQQIVQVLTDCNIMLAWKRSRDNNMCDIVLLIFADLRWLDTVFKKLSYSLLNTFNFCTVKFK